MAQQVDTIVVGGGVSGLACAIALRRRGRDALVLEATERVGGRVRTDEVEGFLLDHGFQVVNVAYPALPRYAPTPALRLRRLPRTAMVRWAGRWQAFGLNGRSLRAPFARARDLAALSLLISRLLPSNRAALAGPDQPAERWLRESGISSTLIDAVFRPLFGGVLLDPTLQTSAKCLRFDLRQFVVGPTALPARGLRAIPESMAAQLPPGTVRTEAPVADLLRENGGRVAGVRLLSGQELRARTVVVATEAPAAARLTGLDVPTAGNGEVCVKVAVDRPLLTNGRILLDPAGAFQNVIELSAGAPSYAPPGQALLALVAPGSVRGEQRAWADRGRETLASWFPGLPTSAVRVLRVERIPFGTLAQPPGIHARLQQLAGVGGGLQLAGEETLAASVNAALLSGERAARRIAAGAA